MKKVLSILIALVIGILPVLPCYATSGPSPLKNVSFTIDGKAVVFKTVLKSGSQLLVNTADLRGSLVKTGENKSTQWVSDANGATIKSEGLEMAFVKGRKTAKVNGKDETLTLAPTYYQKGLYLPVAYVAGKLGFKYLFDSGLNQAFIRNLKDFEEVKSIAAQAGDAMKKVTAYSADMDMKIGMNISGMNLTMGGKTQTKMDKANNKGYVNIDMDMALMQIKSEEYYSDGVVYSNSSFSDGWTKMKLPKGEASSFFESDEYAPDTSFNTDVACMVLTVDKTQQGDEIKLSGKTYLDSMLKMADGASGGGKITINSPKLEITIDKNSMLYKGLTMSFDGTVVEKGKSQKITMQMNMSFKDYNKDMGIVVPEDVLKKAVESDFGF